MAGKDTIGAIAQELGLALQPIETAVSSEGAFSAFMRVLGWDTSGYITAVQNLGSIVTNILSAVEDGLDPNQALNVISQIVNFFNAVSQLSSASGLPGTIDPTEFANDFPGQLVDYLVGRYLLNNRPTLGASLLAAGVIRKTQKPAAGKRPAYVRIDIAWSDLGNVLSDPLSTFKGAYSWGGAAFDQQSFVNNMATFARALGLTVFSVPVSASLKTQLTQGATSTTNLQDFTLRCQFIGNLLSEADFTAGIDLYVLPATASLMPGFALLPYVTGSAGATIGISDELSLVLKAAFDLAGGIFISIRPNQPVSLATGIFGGSPGSAAAFSIGLQNKDSSGTKQLLLGTEGASRLEYASLTFTVGFRTDTQAASFYTEVALTDAALVISPGTDADGFLAKLLPSNLTVDASVTVGLDSRLGIYFSGSSGLEIEIPAHISLGPIEIQSATFSVQPSAGAIPISLGATLAGNLGPLQAVVDDVGLTVNLSFPKTGGNLGPVAAALAFKPPKGVGLSVDAGVVTRRRLPLHRYRPRGVRGRAATGDCRLPLGRGHRAHLHQDARRLQRLLAAHHSDRRLRRRNPAQLRLHSAGRGRPARAESHHAVSAAAWMASAPTPFRASCFRRMSLRTRRASSATCAPFSRRKTEPSSSARWRRSAGESPR